LIEGDYSSASFILAAASITDSYVKITNLRKETLQGDKLIVRILKEMGSQVRVGENYVEVNGAEEGLKGIQIDLHDAPDMAPICVVLGCFAKGETVIKGIKRLRFKESDRVVSVSEELRKMGGNIREYKDKLVIEGEKKITGTELDSHKDHRVAMAFAVAALKAEGTTTIHGIESINKSYPNFVEDLRSLGGKVLVR
jgi:3-phosphoshikimate 1-carboxyvinyltransferase